MAQYRLTRKFAKDIKVTELQLPSNRFSLLDDWVIDVMIIQRKKVAVLTHVKSIVTFFLPYSSIGGAKNVFDFMPCVLNSFLRAEGLEVHIDSTQDLFKEEHIFCKTDNRQILGHMNDIKHCIKAQAHDIAFNMIDWNKATDYICEMTVNVKSYGFTTPRKLFKELLNDKACHIAH